MALDDHEMDVSPTASDETTFEPSAPASDEASIDRRDFLKLGVAAAGTLLVGSLLGPVTPALAASSYSFSWPSQWHCPLGGTTVSVTCKWGAYSLGCLNTVPKNEYDWYMGKDSTAQHLGVDLGAPAGTRVYAIADGRVTAVGKLWNEAGGTDWKSVILVAHVLSTGETFTVAYGHMTVGKSPWSNATWKVGDVVRKGNELGKVATTPYGDHLHLGIVTGGAKTAVPPTAYNNCKHNARGTVDPLTYLPARKPAALTGSIVGWKSGDKVTSWRVVSVNGVLRRAWIPSTTVYWCLRNTKGSVDWGPQPSVFLGQIEDQSGVWAKCP